MRIKYVIGAVFASTLFSVAAQAQTMAPNRTPAPAAPAASTTPADTHAGEWRASKLVGVDVYNMQDQKLGDINEILLDQSGKVAGVVVGVGGFLGMGEHYIVVGLDKLKFMNEPAARTTGSGATKSKRRARAANEHWYPDHAVMDATKDQLKAMPQFKYSAAK